MVMSAAPILHLGARAVCVDCDAAGTDFDYDDLARKLSERAAAVLPVHLWGRAGDTTRLRRFATDHGLAIVADACQALDRTIDGAQVGIEAAIGCFSTHELKLLSTGEAGFSPLAMTISLTAPRVSLALAHSVPRAAPVVPSWA